MRSSVGPKNQLVGQWEIIQEGSKTNNDVKGSFYIAQYPVRWTAQSTLHFCPPWQTCSFRHQLGFSGKHSSDAAITRKD